MESGQLLSDATTLMLLGMGTVFVFLSLLVGVTSSMSALVSRLFPDQPAEARPIERRWPLEDEELLAVISAAIHAHRQRR